MPRRLILSSLLVTSMLSVGACGPFRRGGPENAIILFTNQSIDQANVYAVQGTQQVRIGTVFGGRTDTLRVPGTSSPGGTSVSIVARFLASNRAVTTGTLNLASGDTLSVTLTPDQRFLSVLPPRQP